MISENKDGKHTKKKGLLHFDRNLFIYVKCVY